MGRGLAPNFFFQFSNELLEILFLRQKAAPDCPLERKRSKTCSHSSRLRRTFPSRNFRISISLRKGSQFYAINVVTEITPENDRLLRSEGDRLPHPEGLPLMLDLKGNR